MEWFSIINNGFKTFQYIIYSTLDILVTQDILITLVVLASGQVHHFSRFLQLPSSGIAPLSLPS